MTDLLLLDRAASCYLRAGLPGEAARCYREAGAFRRAGDLFAGLGQYREAAEDYARAGIPALAGWVLVHDVGDPAAARAALATTAAPVPSAAGASSLGASSLGASPAADADDGRIGLGARPHPLRRSLVLARCVVAEGVGERARDAEVLPVLADVCAELAEATTLYDVYVEQWAVALAESMRRYDQVALVFAAAVRGGRSGAAERWASWMRRVLDAELTLPPPNTSTWAPNFPQQQQEQPTTAASEASAADQKATGDTATGDSAGSADRIPVG